MRGEVVILTHCQRCGGPLVQVEHLPALGTLVLWRCEDCGHAQQPALHVQLEKMGMARLPGF
mgnify:CR=1 FL=1